MGDNEEIINKLNEINTKLDLCCPKNYDQATRNIQRVYRGHKDRNTFKQKRRSMKPNVTDTLLDMSTDFGSMIMDKIPEAREEQKIDKQINLLRDVLRGAVRTVERLQADANKTDADILEEVLAAGETLPDADDDEYNQLEYLDQLKWREIRSQFIPFYLKNIENMKEVIKRRNLQEIIKVIGNYKDNVAYFVDHDDTPQQAQHTMSLFDEWWVSDRAYTISDWLEMRWQFGIESAPLERQEEDMGFGADDY